MPEISAGDTAWVLMSAALVMLMTPGLALFYGGLVRRKNVLSTIMHSFFILALVSVTWVLWGYTLAFGPDTGLGLIGGLEWLGLDGVTGEPSSVYATTVPHLAFMAFQMMFAIITPALITGAFAERKRFKAFVIFAVASGPPSSTRRSPTGSGRPTAGSSASACSTSRVAPWSTCPAASPHWWLRCSSAAGPASSSPPPSRMTCR